MNRETFTSKTGLTAIFSILGMALGMYTGAVPIATGAQTIITGLLGLFLRDAVASNGVAINNQQATIEDANAAAQSALRKATDTQNIIGRAISPDVSGKGGA